MKKILLKANMMINENETANHIEDRFGYYIFNNGEMDIEKLFVYLMELDDEIIVEFDDMMFLAENLGRLGLAIIKTFKEAASRNENLTLVID